MDELSGSSRSGRREAVHESVFYARDRDRLDRRSEGQGETREAIRYCTYRRRGSSCVQYHQGEQSIHKLVPPDALGYYSMSFRGPSLPMQSKRFKRRPTPTPWLERICNTRLGSANGRGEADVVMRECSASRARWRCPSSVSPERASRQRDRPAVDGVNISTGPVEIDTPANDGIKTSPTSRNITTFGCDPSPRQNLKQETRLGCPTGTSWDLQ
ncbi:hypothetical protein EDB83DRAFT_2314323 [Lactarius deliciosus]|nr:hypothetical protein EDB83DRAFT_2314323 [Lactarius deliciosus]